MFWDVPVPDSRKTLKSVCEVFGTARAYRLSVDAYEWDGWDSFMEGSLDESEPQTIEFLTRVELATAKIPEIFGSKLLSVDLEDNPAVTIPLRDSMRLVVDPKISAGYEPLGVTVKIGRHTIWERVEDDKGHLFGCATVSVTLYGSGQPADIDRYRAQVVNAPSLIALRERLERHFGPSSIAVYWHY